MINLLNEFLTSLLYDVFSGLHKSGDWQGHEYDGHKSEAKKTNKI